MGPNINRYAKASHAITQLDYEKSIQMLKSCIHLITLTPEMTNFIILTPALLVCYTVVSWHSSSLVNHLNEINVIIRDSPAPGYPGAKQFRLGLNQLVNTGESTCQVVCAREVC
jgi:hypothetical protein